VKDVIFLSSWKHPPSAPFLHLARALSVKPQREFCTQQLGRSDNLREFFHCGPGCPVGEGIAPSSVGLLAQELSLGGLQDRTYVQPSIRGIFEAPKLLSDRPRKIFNHLINKYKFQSRARKNTVIRKHAVLKTSLNCMVARLRTLIRFLGSDAVLALIRF
jgi:hypothetical protein